MLLRFVLNTKLRVLSHFKIAVDVMARESTKAGSITPGARQSPLGKGSNCSPLWTRDPPWQAAPGAPGCRWSETEGEGVAYYEKHG